MKPKRNPKTRRFVLDIMREAKKPLTRREIVGAWMAMEGAEKTDANRRLYSDRIGSCLQICKAQGIAEYVRSEDGETLWQLVKD